MMRREDSGPRRMPAALRFVRASSFVCPLLSVAPTIAMVIFRRPRSHCISAGARGTLPKFSQRIRQRRSGRPESKPSGECTHARRRSSCNDCAWPDPVTLHLGWLLGRPLVVQSRPPWHGRHASIFLAARPAGMARVVRHQLRSLGSELFGTRNLRSARMPGQPADSLCFNVDLSQEWVLLFGWGN